MTRRWDATLRQPNATERVLVGARWAIGRFVRGPGHADWREDNQIGDWPLAVFPGRAVEIAQSRRRAVVANGNGAIFYDAHTPYRRRLIDPRGDDCVYFTVGHATWRELVAHHDPGWTGGDVFRFARGPARPALALRAHRLHRALEADPDLDDLAVEEELVDLASTLVADAAVANGAPDRDDPTTARQRDAVHALEEVVSARFREPLGLDALAAAVDLSPFHAARLFRRFTGSSLHQYRDRLRLLAALPALDGRLDALALELGYASHSHFTDRFTRLFGVPPSAVRSR